MWLPFRRKNKRAIFHYRDGAGPRSIDPLVAWRRLRCEPEMEMHFTALQTETPLREDEHLVNDAAADLADAACRIFDLKPYSPDEPSSVIESEAMAILYSFIEWMALQKKSTNPTPN